MAFDFPATPAANEIFTDAVSGATYMWNGEAWKGKGSAAPPSGDVWVEEAPDDGLTYARKNKAWVETTAAAIRPVVTSLDPVAIGLEDAPGTLVVTGENFTVDSEVMFGLFPQPTTFISATQISTPIDPASVNQSTEIIIGVRTLDETAAVPLPTFWFIGNPRITAMTPTSVAAGSAAFVLTVNGTNIFGVDNIETVITWDGVPIPCDPVTVGGTVTATVTPDAAAGTHQVHLNNGPVPGSSASPPLTFTYT